MRDSNDDEYISEKMAAQTTRVPLLLVRVASGVEPDDLFDNIDHDRCRVELLAFMFANTWGGDTIEAQAKWIVDIAGLMLGPDEPEHPDDFMRDQVLKAMLLYQHSLKQTSGGSIRFAYLLSELFGDIDRLMVIYGGPDVIEFGTCYVEDPWDDEKT